MKTVTFDWGPIICKDCESCICSTLVEYRQQGNSTWTRPSSPTNPTQKDSYPFNINEGVLYEVKLTFIGPQCYEKHTIIPFMYPANDCCPSGYTLSPDKSYCYKVEDVPATPPSGEITTLSASRNVAYGTCGTRIYDPGFNINGTGSTTLIPLSNPFWVNGVGNCIDNNNIDGPLNRAGVWAGAPQAGQDVGFGICIELNEDKTYYVGVGSDNYSVIKVDNLTVLQQEAVPLGNQYSVGPAATFKVWHIYPIQLSAGPHIIEVYGHNVTNAASVGVEIYSTSKEELMAATSYAQLGSKLIFSSKDQIGLPAQLGTGNSGYTCPAGYSLASCESPVVCRKIIKTDVINCS